MTTFELNQHRDLNEKQFYILNYIDHNGQSRRIYKDDYSLDWSYITSKGKRYSESDIINYLEARQGGGEESVCVQSENEVQVESYDGETKETFDSYVEAFDFLSKDRRLFRDDRFYLSELTARNYGSNINFTLSGCYLGEQEKVIGNFTLMVTGDDFMWVETEDDFDEWVENAVEGIMDWVEDYNEDETSYIINENELVDYVAFVADKYRP